MIERRQSPPGRAGVSRVRGLAASLAGAALLAVAGTVHAQQPVPHFADCFNEGEPELSGDALLDLLRRADEDLADVLRRNQSVVNDLEPPLPDRRGAEVTVDGAAPG